jgi:hypothetical protein
MVEFSPDFTFVARRGFLVVGEHDDDSLGEWKERHPEFIQWDRHWFSKAFVDTKLLIADDSSTYCSSGGSTLLFRTRDAARAYGDRDAAIASGLRTIQEVVYVSPPGDDHMVGEAAGEELLELWHDLGAVEGAAALLGESEIVCFPVATGRAQVSHLANQLGLGDRVEFEPSDVPDNSHQ